MNLRQNDDAAKLLFLIESGLSEEYILNGRIPKNNELVEKFVKRRKDFVSRFVKYSKTRAGKKAWRRHYIKRRAALRRYHKSTKGKRIHRGLSRFLRSRIMRPKREAIPVSETFEILKSISSIKTHLFIECDYFSSMDEELELNELLHYAIPIINNIEVKLLENINSDLSEEELELLLRLTHPYDLLKETMKLTKQLYECCNNVIEIDDVKQNLITIFEKDYDTEIERMKYVWEFISGLS